MRRKNAKKKEVKITQKKDEILIPMQQQCRVSILFHRNNFQFMIFLAHIWPPKCLISTILTMTNILKSMNSYNFAHDRSITSFRHTVRYGEAGLDQDAGPVSGDGLHVRGFRLLGAETSRLPALRPHPSRHDDREPRQRRDDRLARGPPEGRRCRRRSGFRLEPFPRRQHLRGHPEEDPCQGGGGPRRRRQNHHRHLCPARQRYVCVCIGESMGIDTTMSKGRNC